MSLPIEDPNEARLQIKLLGTPQIRVDGKLLTRLKSVKAQALLFYLAVTRRIHTRHVLASLLWGDLPESAARANLSKALGLLRKHIGDLLTIERNAISLANQRVCWVDVVEFDVTYQEVAKSGNYNRLQEVVELYRGDFLEGFYVRKAPDYEKWWLIERARLREQYLNSLQSLANHRAKDGDLRSAIELSRRFLDLEPWREEVHQRLMLLLAQNGQRSAALVQYETCRRILAEELDTVPSEGTTALFKRIQVEDLGLNPIPATYIPETKPAQPAFLAENAQDKPFDKTPIVGRDMQLKRLDTFLENALKGQGRVAFISGEAGWGKTSLLDEFSRLAQKDYPDLIVASGTCTITTGIGDPFQPFREIIRMLTGEVEGLWTADAVSTDHALRLWRLLPQTAAALVNHGSDLIVSFISGDKLLTHLATHDSPDFDLMEKLQGLIRRAQDRAQESGLGQQQIFEEFTNVLVDISRNQPILLILDDLHWADASSLGLLFHLSRKISKSRILILGAYRTEEITIGQETIKHPLASILSEIKGLLGDVWVQLGQDHPAESRAFVEAFIDQEPNLLGEDFRQQLTQNTRAHPLFTVEMLRDMRERGHLILNQHGQWIESPSIKWDILPGRVEGVIEKRIGRLTPELRNVLTAASVEGEEFCAEVITRVQNLNEREVVNLLSNDLAKKHHLVEPIGIQQLKEQRISRYHFNHNLFHKYVYGVIDPIERVYMHQAIGEALEDLYQDQTDQI